MRGSNDVPTPALDERRARRTGLVAACLVAVLGTVWALATPLFAAPDEPAHAVRAAATWTGDFSGREFQVDAGRAGRVTIKRYEVPSPYELGQPIAACNAFKALVPAGCGPPFLPTGETTRASSTAGFYPPLFYVMAGWPAAVTEGARSMYLMRLTHVAACAALVGLAAWASARRRGSLALTGLMLSVTPMVAFLSATVNSSGLEITAAIGLWCTLAALLDPPGHAGERRWGEAAAVVVTGLTLCFSRTFSPGYAAVICGITLLSAPGVGVRSLLRRREVLTALAVLAVGGAVATLLIATSGQFDTPATSGVPLPDGETPLSIGLGFQEMSFRQMIAVFGWLDSGTAQLAYYSWLIAVGTLLIGGVVVGGWRRLSGAGLALLATVALPIAANWQQVETAGFVWQGRYSLPFAVGIPILAAMALDESRTLGAPERRRAVIGIGVLAVVAQTYALYWSLRRTGVGQAGDLVFFADATWSPPFLGNLGALLTVVALGVVTVWLLARAPAIVGGAEPDDPGPHIDLATMPAAAERSEGALQ
jgi:hypothetical protein